MNETDISLTPPKISRTVAGLDRYPATVCTHCPSAVFHITEANHLRIYCKIMNALIDENLKACDGAPEMVWK